MILYFTATGNSLYAAEKIAKATGDRLFDIGRAVRRGEYKVSLGENEPLGFVFPVYAWTLPGIVELFIRKMELEGYTGQYAFGVFTCGESAGGTVAALGQALSKRGVALHYGAPLVMVDNYIIWSHLPPPERIEKILGAADAALERIIAAVSARERKGISAKKPEMPCLPIEEVSTAAGRSKLYATDKCTACGLCRAICPMGCIRQSGNARPQWEGLCTQCLACLHRCPAGAIEWAGDTAGKKRYVHPKVSLPASYE
ncbi:MAG: 4Fe-4S binding protein [Clostridiales bacterium]|nr:4Fe-4S binding protein [Clostridiales bacterium]